ncbi:hypothetical protein [Muricoccus vinaceus]|uniref:Uncharacterized protein n=1 Tax=Muricoccus vinaceus TaxID=424704 RepID=A0ABV6J181_9PROT
MPNASIAPKTSSRRLSPKQTAVLIAVLQHGSCPRWDRDYGMIRCCSIWVVGESTHHEADDAQLLDVGLLVRDGAPDAGGRHSLWEYARRYLPTAMARAQFVADAAASDAAA